MESEQSWGRALFLWVKTMTFRFFKGIRDGIFFTPAFELLFWLYRGMNARGK